MSTEQVPASYHESLTAKRADLRSLGACFAEFIRHFSPRAVVVFTAAAVAARIAVGRWSWHDAVVPVVIVAAQPFVEG